jgi:hypothetical protein
MPAGRPARRGSGTEVAEAMTKSGLEESQQMTWSALK